MNKQEKPHGGEELPAAAYRSMIAGLSGAFAVVGLLLAGVAVYLFAVRPQTPLYGGIFLGVFGVFTAVYAVLLCVLLRGLRAARRREGPPAAPRRGPKNP